MAEVVIVGTGAMGREAAAWVIDAGRGGDLRGYLDDDPDRHGAQVADLPVLGDMAWLEQHAGVEVVVAVGSPSRRAHVAERLDAADVGLATIVHPSATVGPRVTLSPGTIVCPAVVLTCDITVGRAVILNYGAMVGHDGVIGDAAFIAPGVNLAGNVTVQEQAEVGIGASVIQGITIGARSVVGAGAVVIRDVPPDTTVVGVPARPIERTP